MDTDKHGLIFNLALICVYQCPSVVLFGDLWVSKI